MELFRFNINRNCLYRRVFVCELENDMKLDDWLILFIFFFVFMFIILLGTGLLFAWISIWVFLLGCGYLVVIFWIISRKLKEE